MIENFFKEGKYTETGNLLIPTCIYPNRMSHKASCANDTGNSASGNLSISGNVITGFSEGFLQMVGKIVKQKHTNILSKSGIKILGYFFDDETNQWTQYWDGDINFSN